MASRTTALALAAAFLFGCDQGSSSSISFPDSPDGTLRVIASSIVKNQPQVLWAALPKSHQQDIKKVIHDFADQLNPEHYNKAFGLLKRVTRLLKDKKSFIFDHPMAGMVDRDGKLAENWGSVIALFDTLVQSDISNIDSLKSLDPGEFLATTGRKLLGDIRALAATSSQNPMAALEKMQVELVKTEDGRSIIKISSPDKPSVERAFVKIDGRWLPEDLVKGWPELMKKAQAAISAMSDDDPKYKMQMEMGLKMVEAVIDQFEKIDDQEAFNILMSSLISH